MSYPSKILFYCQHSLGMGHLVRSSALAGGLAEKFEVHFLNGGRFPKGFRTPKNIKLINLPPLGFDENSQLISRDKRFSVERAQQKRRKMILDAFDGVNPQILIIELFPFGRKKFADELLPLLERAKESGAIVFCSLRDILVNKRNDQAKHDERAANTINEYFNAILIHADHNFAKLEETFKPDTPLKVPVHYTGFVTEKSELAKVERKRQVIVSAGGGIVGEELFLSAIDAQKILWNSDRLRMQIVAGAFLPEDAWQRINKKSEGVKGLKLKRSVRNLAGLISESAVSVSQCGYNTAMDIIRAGVPALVVPYGVGKENEQRRRAERLENLGALKNFKSEQINGESLAGEIREMLSFAPRSQALNLEGVRNSKQIIDEYLHSLPKRIEMTKVMEVSI